MSRWTVSRGDHVRLWLATARLQEAAGKQELSVQSRTVAQQVRATNAWLRDKAAREARR